MSLASSAPWAGAWSCSGLLLAMAVCGCGGAVEATSADAATVDAKPSGADCSASCATRAAKAAAEGFCEPLLVGGDAGFVACSSACADLASGADVSAQARLSSCLETDPLCFQTLAQCMGR